MWVNTFIDRFTIICWSDQVFYHMAPYHLDSFMDAEATIRRTSEPFQFELAIKRVLAEGEELGESQ